MSSTVDQELAELRSANAELLRERDAALTALARRNTEYGERIEYQAATVDVLKAMSASPGDAQPVFDLIATRARDICGSYGVSVFEFDGSLVHLRAWTGVSDDQKVREAYVARFPSPPTRETIEGRAILNRQVVHIKDYLNEPDLRRTPGNTTVRSNVAAPMTRSGKVIGVVAMGSREVAGFSDSQVELLKTFAEQAVIAITSAETYRALHEALEQQTATADVLQVINASPGDLVPVFEALLDKAMHLCEANFGVLLIFDGEHIRPAVFRGVPPAYSDYAMNNFISDAPETNVGRIVRGADIVHIPDLMAEAAYQSGHPDRLASVELAGARTVLSVALRNDNTLLGMIVFYRREVRPFSERQIALLQNFAAQAVIAMENARLLTEQREGLQRQTAMAEVLQVINTSPGHLAPVFDAVLEKAIRLCASSFGTLMTYDGYVMHTAASHGLTQEQDALLVDRPPAAGQPTGRIANGEDIVHLIDAREQDGYRDGFGPTRFFVDQVGARTAMWIALRKDQKLLGILTIFRREVRAFTDKEIELVRSFGAQAVIAMENARLLDELRQRQEELRITFENMGDGVAMFDETPRLAAWNRKFQDIMDLPDGLLTERPTFPDYIRYLAERGEYGLETDPEEEIRSRVAEAGRYRANERVRPDGRVIEIRQVPVAGGGFVMVVSDITERKRNEDQIRAARDAAEEASRTIEAAYRDLKAAQASLIQAEKMASLGQLTAGIAHEIKNPLNFVNNFAELSGDMLDELNEAVANNRQAEIAELTETLKGNLAKITEHGRRADGIVRGMLEHSRGSSGERREVDLNTLVDEALNLAYHGARAQDQSFNVTLQRKLGEGIAPMTLAPQDVTRVLLNLFSNGFYAARERQRIEATADFEPTVAVSTRDLDGAVEIRVRDNGIGILAEIRDRLFQPFFTTKPPGKGTGLGLSMSYDIITQQHGGSISVDSRVGEYSEFTVRLPRSS